MGAKTTDKKWAAWRKSGTCFLCGGPYVNFGNNPAPLYCNGNDRVCAECDDAVVTPARIAIYRRRSVVERAAREVDSRS